MSKPLPSRRDEAWRYADLDALAQARAWPQATDAPASLTRLLRDGERLEWPLMVAAGQADVARTVVVPEGVSAVLIEPYGGDGFLDVATSIRIAPGGQLSHIIVETCAPTAVTTASYQVRMDATACYHAFVLNTGSSYGRIALHATLDEAADFTLHAIQLGGADQTLELVARVDHAAPGAVSHQTVRTVLAGRATGTYLGKIYVAPGAQKTDAEQSSKALVLARTATANTKPELEIYADDVKCAHGATVGELDRAALFYLESRGLDPAQARRLLTQAFVGDVIESCPDAQMREQLQLITQTWLQEALA